MPGNSSLDYCVSNRVLWTAFYLQAERKVLVHCEHPNILFLWMERAEIPLTGNGGGCCFCGFTGREMIIFWEEISLFKRWSQISVVYDLEETVAETLELRKGTHSCPPWGGNLAPSPPHESGWGPQAQDCEACRCLPSPLVKLPPGRWVETVLCWSFPDEPEKVPGKDTCLLSPLTWGWRLASPAPQELPSFLAATSSVVGTLGSWSPQAGSPLTRAAWCHGAAGDQASHFSFLQPLLHL